jgi:hypothetical protein
MCLICIEFQKESLKINEAWRNLQEMKPGMTDEHYDEVVAMLLEAVESEQGIEDEDELNLLLERLEEEGQLSFGFDSSPNKGEKDDEYYYNYQDWSLGTDIY